MAYQEPEIKSLTNIHYDCLERIFDFQTLDGLLNVAQTCNRLHIAANAKLRDDFHVKRVELYLYRPDDWQQGVFWHPDCVYITNWKHCLPFLRCFGKRITKLLVDYNGVSEAQCNHIDQYISEYCGDTLTSIVFIGKRAISIEKFQKPFKNVESASISDAKLKNQLSQFVDWLPNLRRLELHEVELLTGNGMADIQVVFPHLEHLVLTVALDSSKGQLTYGQAMHLLNANRQLHSVFVKSYSVMETAITENGCELIRFVNQYQSIDSLDLRASICEADDAVAVFRTITSLKHFGFIVGDQAQYDRLRGKLEMGWQLDILATHGEDVLTYCVKLQR